MFLLLHRDGSEASNAECVAGASAGGESRLGEYHTEEDGHEGTVDDDHDSKNYGISDDIDIDIDKVESREEREETNRRRRLQREKARRREEKGEKARASLQRGQSENNNEATRLREEENETVNVNEEGGCSHCHGSVATECVYLCQAGHLHRDLPGEVAAFFCIKNIPLLTAVVFLCKF